jgi:hypothetical protein
MSRITSSKKLRRAPAAGLAVALVLIVAASPAFAQDRADGRTLAPAFEPGGAYDIVAPGMYVEDDSGPPAFVPSRGIVNEPCGLPTSACPNAERGAD